MMIATVYIAEGFADTFSAADNFNSPSDASKVLVVIIMLGVLWVPSLLFIGVEWFYSAKVQVKQQPAVIDVEAQRSVVAYIDSTIPEVFCAERTRWSRLWAELSKHHDLFRLFGKQRQQQRRLAIGKTVTVLTFLLFLTAVFFDVSNSGDDGSCENFYTEDSCLKRTSPFDFEQTYCQWDTEADPSVSQCSYKTQSMSMTALFYLTVLTTVLTAIATIPIDYLFSIISAPTAQSLKGSKVMNVVKAAVKGARRLSNVGAGRRPSTVTPVVQDDVPIKTPVSFVKQNRGSLLKAQSFSLLAGSVEDKVIANREVPEEFAQASDAARASIAVIEKNSRVIIQRTSNAAVSLKARSTKRASQTQAASSVSTEKHDIRSSEMTGAAAAVPAMSLLCGEVIEQRRLMNNGADETLVFDAQWGVVTSGSDINTAMYMLTPGAVLAIDDDVFFAQDEGSKLAELLPFYNVHHAGLEILHLFMVDLLGRNTPAAKIFQEKFGEEFGSSQVVVMMQKYLAAALLLGLNGFFAYFILLKAFQKGYQWQIQYLVCSIVQFVIELLVFETTECVWLNYSVPLFVHMEVATAAQKLKDHVESLVRATAQQNVVTQQQSVPGYFLNAPAHLFVSIQVANRLPNLMESMIVSSYTNHLPGEICRTWPHFNIVTTSDQHRMTREQDHKAWSFVPKSLVRGASAAVSLFITIPYLYQRVIIRFVQPIIFSGISVVWFIAIQSIVSVVVLSLLFGTALLYIVWRQFRTSLHESTVAPETEDQSRAEDTVAIDIHPIPTFIQSDGSDSEGSRSSVHLSSESESQYESEYGSHDGYAWEDEDQTTIQDDTEEQGAAGQAVDNTPPSDQPQPPQANNNHHSSVSRGSEHASLSEEVRSVLEEKPLVSDTASLPSAPSDDNEDAQSDAFDDVSAPTDGSECDDYLHGEEQEEIEFSHDSQEFNLHEIS